MNISSWKDFYATTKRTQQEPLSHQTINPGLGMHSLSWPIRRGSAQKRNLLQVEEYESDICRLDIRERELDK